jgi:branched-chain amino acid aminotransferase
MRIFQGEAFAYERHWHRLEKDAGRIHLSLPCDANRVRGHLNELLRANKVVEGTARIYMINNHAGFWRSDEPMPETDLLLCTADLPVHREPARLGIVEHGRYAASPLAGVKVTSWLNNVWNYAEARRQGWDEVVLLNERGEVAECTAANIFCAKNGRVLTPPLSSGCLEGVTRAVLLEIAPASGVVMHEQTLRVEDLYAADEVFITSTNRSLLGISEVAGHTYTAAPGFFAQTLERAFEAAVREDVARRTAPMRG